jgi:uncharacterized OsmC-like protein
MSEKVIVRMNKNYEVGFWAVDPNKPNSEDFKPVDQIYELTPYGKMLASLADCTSQVVITYAHHHNINLEEIKVRAEYKRVFKDDCENCEGIERYDESIQENITFQGDLTADQHRKLFMIARQCSIHKMFQQGIEIQSDLVESIET